MCRHWASSAMQQDPIQYSAAVSIIISKIYFFVHWSHYQSGLKLGYAYHVSQISFLIITSRHY